MLLLGLVLVSAVASMIDPFTFVPAAIVGMSTRTWTTAISGGMVVAALNVVLRFVLDAVESAQYGLGESGGPFGAINSVGAAIACVTLTLLFRVGWLMWTKHRDAKPEMPG